MSSKRISDIDPAVAARRRQLVLEWRDDWRRESAGGQRPAPAKRKPKPEPKRNGADFAAAIARAEFGRHYLDPRANRQGIENGAVVMRSRPLRRRG